MGNRASSVLCYGIHITEDDVPWNDEKFEYDMDEYLVWKLTGKRYRELPDGEARRIFKRWTKEHGVTWESAGHYDYVEGILCMKDSVQSGCQDTPTKIEPVKMTMFDKEKWNATLREVCELLDVKYVEPAWLMGSYYG
jgi:hypothetical protein